MLPSASDLTYFVEVAQTLNLSRASERLGISQPSLTLAMQRLDTSVGTPLLTRNKRGVALTQAGKQLLSHSQLLLQSWHNVKSQALASVHEVQGSYTIGCHPSVALFSLPHVLPSLLKKNQNINIRLIHDLSRRIAEGVISGSIDVGIVVNPVRHPDLVLHKLCDDEVTLWQGESYQFDRTSYVLLCDIELMQSQALLKQLKDYNLYPSRVVHSNNLEVIANLTEHGCGVGILPSKVAHASAHRRLKKIQPAPIFSDEIYLLYRLENRLVRAIQTIKETVQMHFKAK